MRNILLITISFSSVFLVAQQENKMHVKDLDTVKVSLGAFTVEDFIRMSKTDTSFFKAFKNSRITPHLAHSKVLAYTKDGGDKATMKRKSELVVGNQQAIIHVLAETTNGKYYKRNGGAKFYTAAMFEKVFFPKDSLPLDNRVNTAYTQQQADKKNKEAKHYEQLKTFMFNPGNGVEGVPFISKKLNIYEAPMRDKYDFILQKTLYKDTVPVYLFSVKRKNTIKDKAVSIEYIHTYYDRRTMNIIARTYHLKDATLLFSFDIKIRVELMMYQQDYYPTLIHYQGEWSVPLKTPERIEFDIQVNYDDF